MATSAILESKLAERSAEAALTGVAIARAHAGASRERRPWCNWRQQRGNWARSTPPDREGGDTYERRAQWLVPGAKPGASSGGARRMVAGATRIDLRRSAISRANCGDIFARG